MSKRVRIIIAIAIVVLLAGGIAYAAFRGDEDTDEPEPSISQLTGEEIEPELADRPVLGVVIENTEEARPQNGLDSAGIVFETVTEGDITRTLAFYQEDMPEEFGPIRSLRPYFVDWVMGFDASIAHVGGSAEALQLVKQRDTKSLNQFDHPEPYYRVDNRPAPHNMYASPNDLRDLQNELDHEKSQFRIIPRSDDSPSDDPTATTVNIDYSTAAFEVAFHYDASGNAYTRHLAGDPHIDNATGQPITVKNVVVIMTESQEDTTKATGSGEALVFKNGDVQEVTWQKTNYDERIELIDEEGSQIDLNRGDSWFAVLPADRPVNY